MSAKGYKVESNVACGGVTLSEVFHLDYRGT